MIFCIGIVAYVDPVGAQFESLNYKVGDLIEIRYFDNWFEAKVTEILPRGVALKAEFTDETGEKTTSVFTSRDIRERHTSPTGKSLRSDVGDMTEQGMVRVPLWVVTLFRWGPFSVLFLGGLILFTVGLLNSNKYY